LIPAIRWEEAKIIEANDYRRQSFSEIAMIVRAIANKIEVPV
jgi:hypothetical protein